MAWPNLNEEKITRDNLIKKFGSKNYGTKNRLLNQKLNRYNF